MNESVLITIGHPASDIPVLPFVKTDIQDSPKDAAKKLRKTVAENPKGYSIQTICGIPVKHLAPADLYWACYHTSTDEKPFLASDNFWCRESLKKEFEQKAEQERLQRMGERAIRMIELQIHKGKCPNCECYALVDGTCTACGANICPECFSVMDENFQCSNCGEGL